MRKPWYLLGTLSLVAALPAAEGDDAPGDEAPPPAPEEADPDLWPPGPWEISATFGAYFNSTATVNADDSRDATINGTEESIAYQLSFDGTAIWRHERHVLEDRLQLRYGRIKQEDDAWEENNDLIDYDGVYKYTWRDPHYLYGAVGFDTVFTGVEPDEELFDPFTVKASGGYGQRRVLHQKTKRILEFRVGVRAQRSWGDQLTPEEEEWEIGPEVWARYQANPLPKLKYWIEYEAFGEFEDLGHWTNLVTASFVYQFTDALSLKVDLRAYLETEPDDATTDVGYDELSVKQDTLIGITYTF